MERGDGMIIKISVAIIALAFAALVVFLILTLRSAQESLNQVNETLTDVQKQLNQVSQEAITLIQSTNQVTADVNRKMKSLDTVFESIDQVGESVHQVTSSVKQVSATVSQSLSQNIEKAVHDNGQKMQNILQWSGLALNLLKQWQQYKSSSSKEDKTQND